MNNEDDLSRDVPPEREPVLEPEDALPELTLAELPESMRAAAGRAGWSSLMAVQAKAMPYLLEGRDLMVQSRTGSGKTGAFVLPIIGRVPASARNCRALVLVPTRELARQVAKEAVLLAGPDGPRTVAVYGGVGYKAQLDAFRAGASIVVGTPGRVLDHLERRSLHLDDLELLIFDEADRMLSMGFYPDMVRVQGYLPRRRIDGAMFSATWPPHVLRLAGQFLDEPEMLSLSADHVHVPEIAHRYHVVDALKKDRALIRVIEIENPAAAIIFCNTRAKVEYVNDILQSFGYDADALSSDLRQRDRESVLQRVRDGKLKFLVATDVAARGIDIPELSHVIQYEPPEDPEGYIHRAGRTGRAGAGGKAITLVAGIEEMTLRNVGKRFDFEIEERPLPTDEQVETVVSERLTALLETRLRGMRKLRIERLRRFLPLARNLAGIQEESLLLAMLLDDSYQQSLHAPVVSADEELAAPPARRNAAQQRPSKPRDGGQGKRRRGGRRRD